MTGAGLPSLAYLSMDVVSGTVAWVVRVVELDSDEESESVSLPFKFSGLHPHRSMGSVMQTTKMACAPHPIPFVAGFMTGFTARVGIR
jgi:hypothetical protein